MTHEVFSEIAFLRSPEEPAPALRALKLEIVPNENSKHFYYVFARVINRFHDNGELRAAKGASWCVK